MEGNEIINKMMREKGNFRGTEKKKKQSKDLIKKS